MDDVDKGADRGTSGRSWPQGGHSIHQLGRPDITELELGKKTHKVAAVEPMDLDGVATMTVGTIVWIVAAVVLFVMRGDLADDGHTWWIAVALTGAALGVVGIFYCQRRKVALAAAAQSSELSTGLPAGSPADSPADS